MKKSAIGILFLFIAASMAQAAVFKGSIKNLNGWQVSYYASAGGMLLPDLRTVEISSDSTFTITVPDGAIERISLLMRGNGKNFFSTFYIGSDGAEVTIDPTTPKGYEPVYGIDSADIWAAEAVESVNTLFWDLASGAADPLQLRSDSCAVSVKTKLSALADSILPLVDSTQKTIRYILRQDLAMNILEIFNECRARSTSPRRHPSDSILAAWQNTADEVYGWAQPDNQYNAMSLALSRLANSSIQFKNRNFRPAGIDEYYLFANDFYRKNFSGRNAELLAAQLIFEDSKNGRYSQCIPGLVAQFKKEYPDSPLMAAVDSALAKNLKANTPVENPDIHFLNNKNVDTLADLLKAYRGKTVLIDVWATWCGPCREAFSKIKPVQEAAREKDIVLLYISMDEGDGCEKNVQKVVNSFGLTGEHIIVNPALKADIFKTFGNKNGIISIPHTALIAPNGSFKIKKMDESENPEALAAKLRAL